MRVRGRDTVPDGDEYDVLLGTYGLELNIDAGGGGVELGGVGADGLTTYSPLGSLTVGYLDSFFIFFVRFDGVLG